MRLAATIILLASAAAAPAQTPDEIFSATFEYRCDGNGCTYCSPADPPPVCGSDSHCIPDAGASLCTYPAGAGTSGAVCSTRADCAGPYECITPNGSNFVCQQWCQFPSGICPGGQTCQAFSTPALIGGTEWGVCL